MSSENQSTEAPATEEETALPSAAESVEEPAAADVVDAAAEVGSALDVPVEDAAPSSAQESDKEGTATVDVNSQPKPEQPKKPILDDGANKIFVGGISQETSDDDLRAYFGQHGEIVDITIMKDRMTGKSRGFGFITFDTSEVADKMVASKHEINGRMVEAKPAVPRGSQAQMGQRPSPTSQGSDPSQRATKIFVGGLSPSVNDAELKEYFSQYGTVVEASVSENFGENLVECRVGGCRFIPI
uniref:RRM domain-containing protein n=1 Tax=Cryptomonas curvata TaxID=233186 RepID=A0A7S0ML85_9CRYP|mmetsp:Transcript_43112/g.90230  ORF Transcript_43112/g.90230 Transcript_43112/m.90230 type:complete len:243 (+) Transcript_43112:2-730(+)